MKDDPAFPVTWANDAAAPDLGLTKRELFAALAMQGLTAFGKYEEFEDFAHDAVKIADALLAELEK